MRFPFFRKTGGRPKESTPSSMIDRCQRRGRSSSSSSASSSAIAWTGAFHEITWNDIAPHLRFGLPLTGTFVVAWCWDLVLYGGISHAGGRKSVARSDQFCQCAGTGARGGLLLSQYLFACAVAAGLSHAATATAQPWSPVAVRVVEFLPSPVFAGETQRRT